MRPLRRSTAPLVVILGAALATACGDFSGLPPAGTPNEVDTLALFALDGTPISTPSAYHLVARSAVRTDRIADFDFAFNIDTLGRPVLLVTGALGLGEGSGIAITTQPFDSIKTALGGGYERAKPVPVDVGTTTVIHSRLAQCGFGTNVFYYAKLQVLDVDLVARRLDFRILVDANCGYRGLEPGLPKR